MLSYSSHLLPVLRFGSQVGEVGVLQILATDGAQRRVRIDGAEVFQIEETARNASGGVVGGLYANCKLFRPSSETVHHRYYYQKISYWKKLGINGPLALPLFGNEWEKYWKGQQRCELEWFQNFGKIYGTFNDKLEPSLTIVDPELVKQIMSYYKPSFY
ncbi:Cytochrome P450 3A4 [Tyrophagus putrescentiae]|nr:Cytochrome P450 3A4 [Tyrophagus putrescentiae]